MTALKSLLDLAERMANLDLPGVYVVHLEGSATDTAAFPNFPRDEILTGTQGRRLGRDMAQVHFKGDQVSDVYAMSMELIVRKQTKGGWSWYLDAASQRPWTPDAVVPMLDKALGDPSFVWDIMGRFPHGQCLIVGPGMADQEMGSAMSDGQRAPTVIGHATTTRARGYYERVLDQLAKQFRGLVNFVVYDDPRGRARAVYARGLVLERTIGLSRDVPVPPVGGLVAIIPDKVPQSLVPADLPLTLSRVAGDDPDAIRRWVTRLATLPLAAEWPRTRVYEDEDARLRQFSRVLTLKPENLLARDVLEAQRAFTEANEVLVMQTARADGLEAARSGYEQRIATLTATLDELNTRYQTQRAILADLKDKSEHWAGADLDALEQQLAQEKEVRARAEQDAETFEAYAGAMEAERDAVQAECDALKAEAAQLRLRVPSQADAVGAEPEEAVVEPPEKWAELPGCAAAFSHLAFSQHAFDETVKRLASHKRSKQWLRTTWLALRALEAYVVAKQEVRATGLTPGPGFASFRAYLNGHPAEDLPETLVSMREGKQVNMDPRFRGARTFIGPTGSPVFMEAHVVIGSGGPPAPRLHFYDDTDGPTGQIWVGYVGPHLPNTLT